MVGWHYPPPYDVYDLGGGDAVDEVVEDLLDPNLAYTAILDPQGALVAFCCFGVDARVPGGDYSAGALDIGLGLRPDRTGQGQGRAYAQAVLDYAASMAFACAEAGEAAEAMYRVTIAAFNVRAQRVWQKLGFRPTQRFTSARDGRPFLVYVREAEEGGASSPAQKGEPGFGQPFG
jgi:GNAT superfamily N-acetyltransferase